MYLGNGIFIPFYRWGNEVQTDNITVQGTELGFESRPIWPYSPYFYGFPLPPGSRTLRRWGRLDHSESRGSGCPTLTKSPTAATDQSRLHCKVTKADGPAGRLPNSLPSCLLTIWPSSLILRLSLFKDPLKGTEALLGFSKGPHSQTNIFPSCPASLTKKRPEQQGFLVATQACF